MSNTTGNTGRNAYEIRLEVLQMALGMADNGWHSALEQIRNQAEHEAAKEGKTYAYELPPDNRKAEALAHAAEFYKFVENKQ